MVTAVNKGTSTITVETVDGGFTATSEITVIRPLLNIDVSSLDFGTIDMSQTATKKYTISNIGTAPLIISNLEFIGSNPTSFSTPTATPLTIAPGDNAEVEVVFEPKKWVNKTHK